MIYAFVDNCYSTKSILFVAKDEQEMLSKLLKKFKHFSAKSLDELQKKLKDADYGQGSPGWTFEIVDPE